MFKNLTSKALDCMKSICDFQNKWCFKCEHEDKFWHNAEKELPECGAVVLALDANTGGIEIGFRSTLDTEIHDWIDFSIPVTHWAYIDWPEECYNYDELGWPIER